MGKKPELLVTPKDLDAVTRLFDAGADAIMIGEERYGLRLPGDFSREEIEQATAIAHERG